MKKIYILCVILMIILALIYALHIRSMGFNMRQGALFFGVFAATVIIGFLIVKLLTKKIGKSMEDN